MVVGNSAGFALGSLKSHPPTMSLTHCTTEREAKYSKLGHICLRTKVPTLLYDVALGALSFTRVTTSEITPAEASASRVWFSSTADVRCKLLMP